MMVPLFAVLLALVPPMPGGGPPEQEQQPVMPRATPVTVPSSAAPALSDAQAEARAKEWLQRLQSGDIDRSQLSPEVNSALTQSVIDSIRSRYGPLGAPTSFTLTGEQSLTNGDTAYSFRVAFKQTTMIERLVVNTAGKIDGLWLAPGG